MAEPSASPASGPAIAAWELTQPLLDGARIRLRLQGDVALVEHRNPVNGCFDATSETELAAALDRLDAEPGLRVLVLTGGEPGIFIRHYDLPTLRTIAAHLQRRGLQVSTDRPLPEAAFPRLARRLSEAPYVTIAAINGVTMGGGLELALACDIRVAQDGDYPIGLPELGVGILPGAGGTQRLPQLLGTGRALYHLFTGRMQTPRQALQAGLVDECVPEAVARALAIADHVRGLPRRACTHAKRLVRGADSVPLDTGLAHERTLLVDCLLDPEALARLDAVLTDGKGLETLALAPTDQGGAAAGDR